MLRFASTWRTLRAHYSATVCVWCRLSFDQDPEPDSHQNLTDRSFGHEPSLNVISSKCIYNFYYYQLTKRQTNRHTNGQSLSLCHVTFFGGGNHSAADHTKQLREPVWSIGLLCIALYWQWRSDNTDPRRDSIVYFSKVCLSFARLMPVHRFICFKCAFKFINYVYLNLIINMDKIYARLGPKLLWGRPSYKAALRVLLVRLSVRPFRTGS